MTIDGDIWTENADGTYSCSACKCAPFEAGRACECNAATAKKTAKRTARAEIVTGRMTIDDYERELHELGKRDAEMCKAYYQVRRAARSIYYGGTKGGKSVHVPESEAGKTPRHSYECQRDSVRLEMMALDAEVKFLAERRKRLEILYRMALKRAVFEAVEKDHETAILLRGGVVPGIAVEAN